MPKPDSPTLLNGHKPNSPTSEPEPEPEPNNPSHNAQIPRSVSQLEALATAILRFKSLYDELTNHLKYIEKCIDARTETQSEVDLITLCKNMQGKSLRRYIIERLNHVSKLREELPRAIRSAQNPAQLVLDCIGRFYVQGKKAFEKEAQIGAHRRACVLGLEALLKGYEEEEGVVLVGEEVRSEGFKGARDWMARVRVEGGLAAAHEMDARGLLLFVACFGVPEGFTDDEVWDLVVAADFKRLALRKSPDLVARIPLIVEKMMKNGMKIEAIDVVLAFGLEDKFPLEKILVLYLKGCDEAFKRKKREAKDNPNLLKETIEKQLTTLKSAMKFIEDHKQEGLQHPPGWDLNEMISKVQKEHNNVGRKMNDQHANKRKAEQDRVELIEDIKRSRFVSAVSIQNSGRNECATVRHVDGNIPFYSSMRTEMFEDGLSHHDDVFAACEPRMYGSYMGSFPETVLHEQRATDHWNLGTSYDRQLYSRSTLDTSFQGAGIGYFPETIPVRMARAGSHVQSGGVGPMTIYNDQPTSFVNGVHRGTEVDRTRHIMGQPSGSCGIRDTAHDDRPVGQGSVGELASGLFARSSSIERFVGFPISPPSGSAAWSSADLYKFVDAVVEMEYGRSSTSYYHQQ